MHRTLACALAVSGFVSILAAENGTVPPPIAEVLPSETGQAFTQPSCYQSWFRMASAIREAKDGPKPAQVAASLHAFWSQSPRLKDLSLGQISILRGILESRLDGAEMGRDLALRWAQGNDRWKNLDGLASFSSLGTSLLKPEHENVRKELVRLLLEERLACQPVEAEDIAAIRAARPMLAASEREKVVARLDEAWTDPRVKSADPAVLGAVGSAYEELGSVARAAEFAACCLAMRGAETLNFEQELRAGRLLGGYAGGDERALQQRAAMAGRLWDRYFGSAQKLRTVPREKLGGALAGTVRIFDEDRRKALAGHVVEVLAGTDPDAAKVTLEEVYRISRHVDVRKPLMLKLDSRWRDDCRAGRMTWQACRDVARTCADVGLVEPAGYWAGQASEILCRQGGTVDDFFRLTEAMHHAGLLKAGRVHPEYGPAIVAALKARQTGDLSDWQCYLLALPLGTPANARKLLVEAFPEPSRYDVLRMLAWIHQEGKDVDAWRRWLDERATSAEGDAKAQWLMGRYYLECVRSSEYCPADGQEWYGKALAAATSPATKAQFARVHVLGYLATGQPQQAQAVLEEAFRLIPDDPGQRLTQLRRELEAKAEAARQQAQKQEAARERQNKELRRAELQRRLAEAKNRNDTEAIERYSRLLGQ